MNLEWRAGIRQAQRSTVRLQPHLSPERAPIGEGEGLRGCCDGGIRGFHASEFSNHALIPACQRGGTTSRELNAVWRQREDSRTAHQTPGSVSTPRGVEDPGGGTPA